MLFCFLKINSLHLPGLHDILLFADQFIKLPMRLKEVSICFYTGATIVVSSAYLNNAGQFSRLSSRSLRNTLKR